MPQIHELSATELARQIRDRTISPVEVAQALLARMDALESQLDAWVRVDRERSIALSPLSFRGTRGVSFYDGRLL